jgi:hypothetical protein
MVPVNSRPYRVPRPAACEELKGLYITPRLTDVSKHICE